MRAPLSVPPLRNTQIMTMNCSSPQSPPAAIA
jgi:hypothetical protein